jgi:phospholipid/cholesterol/gamma-HCH transport system substrate-binding protein
MTTGASTELKVGIFTVVGLTVLCALILVLEGNPFSSKLIKYHTIVDNVGGVGQRTQVRTSGVQVGEVSEIEILPDGAKVNFKIGADVVIPEGSFIELKSRGILGDVYLEIVRNQASKVPIKPDSLVPKMKEFNDMNSLMTSMGSIATDIKQVSSTLSQVFGTEDGKSSLKNILANVENITKETRELMIAERKNISRIISGIVETTDRLNAVLERNDSRVDSIMKDVSLAAADARLFTAELKSMVGGSNKGRLENILASIDTSMVNIKLASAKVQNIVDKVEKGEGTVGQLLSKDDTANELKNTLKTVQDILKPAAKLKVEVDYKGEMRSTGGANVSANGNIGKYGNHFNVRLSTRPDKYYILGISDSPNSRTITNIRTTEVNQATNETVVREVKEVPEDRQRLRFNAQFAKRFDPIAVRFGLFESYAGIASDVFLFKDKLSASVEIFNFGDDTYTGPGSTKGFARVKAYSNLFLTPNIYVTGGADNIARSVKPLGFFGAGLRFTDDDLKAIAGAAALGK